MRLSINEEYDLFQTKRMCEWLIALNEGYIRNYELDIADADEDIPNPVVRADYIALKRKAIAECNRDIEHKIEQWCEADAKLKAQFE